LNVSFSLPASLDVDGGGVGPAGAAEGTGRSVVCVWLVNDNKQVVVVVDVGVSFQIIKDFYLLGRGELYQVFIDLAQHMLKTPPTAVSEHGALTTPPEPSSAMTSSER